MNAAPIATAIFVFPDVEVLDFAGPYEVFASASRVSKMMDSFAPAPFTVFTIVQNEGSLRARAGLSVIPDYTFANHPVIDLLIIPGGVVSAQLQTPAIAEWIKHTAPTTKLTASVCNGALLLAQAGLLDGRRCTTHWSDVGALREVCSSLTVLEETRWVDEGPIVTSGGISAGIDMCLHLRQSRACGSHGKTDGIQLVRGDGSMTAWSARERTQMRPSEEIYDCQIVETRHALE